MRKIRQTKVFGLLIGTVAAGAFTTVSVAVAADMPLKAPAPVYPAADWSGFYIGVNGGGGWGHFPLSDTVTNTFVPVVAPVQVLNVTVGDISSSGGVVGGHFGYNWQYYNFVGGLEVDAGYADIRGTTSSAASGVIAGVGTASASLSLQERIASLGSARGRLGWLPTSWLLIYGTGGLAWERLETTSTQTSTVLGSMFMTTAMQPTDRFGFVAGVGAEAKLFGSNNWLGRVEYLHYDFGNLGSLTFVNTTGPSGPGNFTSGSQTVDVVRGGLTYKFGP